MARVFTILGFVFLLTRMLADKHSEYSVIKVWYSKPDIITTPCLFRRLGETLGRGSLKSVVRSSVRNCETFENGRTDFHEI
jgi:hypothetical protein